VHRTNYTRFVSTTSVDLAAADSAHVVKERVNGDRVARTEMDTPVSARVPIACRRRYLVDEA
jgi:hypothetical protein